MKKTKLPNAEMVISVKCTMTVLELRQYHKLCTVLVYTVYYMLVDYVYHLRHSVHRTDASSMSGPIMSIM